MVKKGDNYIWGGKVSVQVTRVAIDGTWADIACQVIGDIGIGTVWFKRQVLPFPDNFVRDDET